MKKNTLFSKLRKSKIPKYLMIGSVSLGSLFLSPLEEVISEEIKDIKVVNEFNTNELSKEYKELILKPYEHDSKNESLDEINTNLKEYQLKRDKERFKGLKNFELLYDFQKIDYNKNENNDFLINYYLDGERVARTDSIINYLGGYYNYDSKIYDTISLVKLLNESKIFFKEGLPKSSQEYEILYQLPLSEIKNLGGIKNPITFSYSLRMLQSQDLSNSDLRRQKVFQNSSLEKLIDEIDLGYNNQENSKLNEIYKDNPANTLGKAKLYSVMALNEINDLEKSEKLNYFNKSWELVNKSKELFDKRDSEWYKYLNETYGEKGIDEFNKQMIILYSTTVMPSLYERHNLNYEDINMFEKRDELIIPLIQDYFEDEREHDSFVDKLNQVLWQQSND